jgi:hypothetical protein
LILIWVHQLPFLSDGTFFSKARDIVKDEIAEFTF